MTYSVQTSSQSRKNIVNEDQSKVITELKAKLASAEAKSLDFGEFQRCSLIPSDLPTNLTQRL